MDIGMTDLKNMDANMAQHLLRGGSAEEGYLPLRPIRLASHADG